MMTRDLHDIEGVFAAFGMPCFPYRTFPPAAVAQRGAAPPDRRRERLRADVRRPEGADLREPLRRVGGDDVPAFARRVSPHL